MTAHPSLPLPATSFVGREAELEELQALLGDPEKRLITLVGPGGSGKTRLSVEVAQRIRADSLDTYFADLDAVDDVRDLPLAIADALEIRLAGSGDTESQLHTAAAGCSALLVLDNFEHLVERAGLVSELLRSAPDLKVLVTSRVVLGVSAEWVFPVGGLELPPAGEPVPPEMPAIRLFMERASRRNVRLPADEMDAVATICRTVEGNPLAIELAASWARSLSLDEIAQEVSRRLPSLESALRDVPERHRSVLAVFERSWAQLDDEDRAVLVRMAAFEGGFSREAATGPIGASLPRLAGLVDRSLVQPRGNGRYGLHEMVRQCVLEHGGDGELPVAAREAHLAYVAKLVGDLREAIEGHGQAEACDVLDRELGNIRAAVAFAVRSGNAERLLELMESFGYFLVLRGRHREALDFAERLLADPSHYHGDARAMLASAHQTRGWAHIRFGQLEGARADFLRSQELMDDAGIVPLPGLSYQPDAGLAVATLTAGDYEGARGYASRLRAAASAAADPMAESIALYVLGNVAHALGDVEAARDYSTAGLTLAVDHGDEWFAAYLRTDLARLALAEGNVAEAERHAEAAYATRKRFGDDEGMALALLQLSRVSLEQNDLDRGERMAREALVLYRGIGDRGGIARAQSNLVVAAALEGQHEAAIERAIAAIDSLASTDVVPIELEVLTAVAEVFVHLAEPTASLDLLHLILREEAAAFATRRRAEALKAAMALPPQAVAESVRRSARLTVARALQASRQALAEQALSNGREGHPVVQEQLTRREHSVLEMLARGASNAEVAERLGISAGTVKWYTTRLYGKLGVRNRTEAVNTARSRGLVG